MDFASLTLSGLQTAYEASTPQADELRRLLANIVANRRLRFSREEAQTTYPALLGSGQLAPDGTTWNGTHIAITESPLFYYGLYHTFGARFHYMISADLAAGYHFLDQSESFVFESGQNYGGNKVIRGLMEWILHFAIAELGADISDFILGHSFKRDSTLNAVLLTVLLEGTFLNSLSIEQIWPIFRHLANEMEAPEAGVHDPSWNRLQVVVQETARLHPEQAGQIKAFALQDLPTRPAYYIALSALAGLWQAGQLPLPELLDWIDQPHMQTPALTLLRVLPFQTPLDRQSILDKLASTQLAPEELYNLPPVYSNFLNAAEATETKVIEQCNEGLTNSLESPDPGLVRVTLVAITRLTREVAIWMDRFIARTQSGRYDHSFTSAVNGLFGAHPIAEKFGAFIAAYTTGNGRFNTYKHFDYALHLVQQHSSSDLDQALIRLMINDHGSARWAGHLLYSSLIQHGQRATFQFDVLTLNELEQRKLAVSLLQPFYPVEQTVPPCIPLLSSPYLQVRQLVQDRLLELTYSYQEVLAEVDSLLPAGTPDRESIIAPLRTLNEAILAESQTKLTIAEFDPRQTQPIQLRRFLQGFTQRARQSFQTAQEGQGGIMAFARKVPVNRGGGWKPFGSPQMRPMGDFHYEMPISRMGVFRPEAMDEQYHDLFSADWHNDFDTWVQKQY